MWIACGKLERNVVRWSMRWTPCFPLRKVKGIAQLRIGGRKKGDAPGKTSGSKVATGCCCPEHRCKLEECLTDEFHPQYTCQTCTHGRLGPMTWCGRLCGCNVVNLCFLLLHRRDRWNVQIQPFDQVHYHRVPMPMHLVEYNGRGRSIMPLIHTR